MLKLFNETDETRTLKKKEIEKPISRGDQFKEIQNEHCGC